MSAVLVTWALGLAVGICGLLAVAAILVALIWLFATEDGQGVIVVVFGCGVLLMFVWILTVGAWHVGRWLIGAML